MKTKLAISFIIIITSQVNAQNNALSYYKIDKTYKLESQHINDLHIKSPDLYQSSAAMISPAEKMTETASDNWFHDPDFWLATTVNLAGTALFLARLKNPKAARYFGYATEALGIPALTMATFNIVSNTTDFCTWANLGYGLWAIYAVIVDHILKIEFRNPFRYAIIVPYVASYFAAIGSMSAAQINNGYLPWGIAGVTCIINVGASFYSRSKGGDRL